jgi:ribosomal protein S10
MELCCSSRSAPHVPLAPVSASPPRPQTLEGEAPAHKIRITLSSGNVAALEKGACSRCCAAADASRVQSCGFGAPPPNTVSRVPDARAAVCADLKRGAEEKGLKGRVRGPVRLPTKVRRPRPL